MLSVAYFISSCFQRVMDHPAPRPAAVLSGNASALQVPAILRPRPYAHTVWSYWSPLLDALTYIKANKVIPLGGSLD